MSSLQIGLAILGALVLALIALQAAWIARRQALRRGLDGTANLPLGESAGARGSEPANDSDTLDAAGYPAPTLEAKAALDALIDVVVSIALDAPLPGETALTLLPPTRRVGSKPFSIEGFNSSRQCWEIPAAGQRYELFQAGVQLANRLGALNDIEYSEFVIKTQDFCEAINATPDFEEMLDVVARARELDQFASDHDAQLVFVVAACHAAWSPAYVQQNALRLGFVATGMPGRLLLPAGSPGLPGLLTLNFDPQAAAAPDTAQASVRQLLLSLDVPHVARSELPFKRLREAALTLAERMDGRVTDDQGLALVPSALDVIGSELEGLYDRLEQRDLAAGSALARRLFS